MSDLSNKSINTTLNQKNETLFEVPDLLVQLISLTVFFFVTLFGNLAVIVIIFYSKLSKKNKKVRIRFSNVSRMSFYIFNLSICDICVAFFSILPTIFELNDLSFLSNSATACKAVRYLQVNGILKYLVSLKINFSKKKIFSKKDFFSKCFNLHFATNGIGPFQLHM